MRVFDCARVLFCVYRRRPTRVLVYTHTCTHAQHVHMYMHNSHVSSTHTHKQRENRHSPAQKQIPFCAALCLFPRVVFVCELTCELCVCTCCAIVLEEVFSHILFVRIEFGQ